MRTFRYRRARRYAGSFGIASIALVLLLVLQPIPISHSAPPTVRDNESELRGVWLTNVGSGVLFAPWGVNRAIAQLAQLNFNTLYPVVWNRGRTFYPSSVATEEPLLKLARGGSDVLAEILKAGHRSGLRVIPWFEYGLIVPAHSAIARGHPNWLTHSQESQTSSNRSDAALKKRRSRFVETFSDLHKVILDWMRSHFTLQQVWLNPFRPGVQQFLTDLIVEVVARYDVDGIQLDDHFGLPVELGYDPYTIKLYQQQHQGKSPPNNPSDPEWMRWRAKQLTDFVRQIARAVKAVKPDVILSLSPNSQAFSYNNYLQDWPTWVEKGWVEELVLQVYRNDLESFQTELSQTAVQLARRKIPVSVGIVSGTWRNPVPMQQIQQQVKFARERGFAGISFFYWESLWGYITPESPQKRREGFQNLFVATERTK